MGKAKKKFNWKSRQLVKTEIDKSEEKKILLDLPIHGYYDDANPMVLPSKKRKTKVEKIKVDAKQFLSKKKRKELEKIVERKKKKENRGTLLEELAKVQATPEDLSKMVSISVAQTKGLKRRYKDDEPFSDFNDLDQMETITNSNNAEELRNISSVKGASKKRRRLLETINILDGGNKRKKNYISDPNVIGFTSSEEDDNTSEEEKEEEEIPEIKKEVEDVLHPEIIHLGEDSEDEHENQALSNEPPGTRVNDKKVDTSIQQTNKENTEQCDKTKEEIKSGDVKPRIPAVYIPVQRTPEIQEARLKLPILAEEQGIMETINENPVVIIAGATGSGKTTQVPQFLYEAGYTSNGKMIGITEPRRVAAISMSKRVGEELNLGTNEVSYLIRFEGNVTPETKIKFMTDGVLLKEIRTDFLLTKYSVIILDEAHERSVYTDILLGLLSRIVKQRNKRELPLKLIIMSATLKLKDFTENEKLFMGKIPPVIKVETRQFPVSVYFNKRTQPDYVKEAYRKTCKIHTQLPEGGILIFVTGQQEVNSIVKQLRKAFPFKKSNKEPISTQHESMHENKEHNNVELNLDNAIQQIRTKRKEKQIVLPEINLDDYDVAPKDDTEVDLLDSDGEDEEDWGDIEMTQSNAEPLWVLPLYSVLPSSEQAKVFQKPPDDCRLCVVATNVAETSLTIPGVKYVVDSGKVKVKLHDKVTGVSGFKITWTSKAGADQRAGRAGRTSPGFCYRLYSSAVFNDDFEEWLEPEIKRRPIDDLVLHLKSLGIARVINFPFPSPPDGKHLKQAEKNLIVLGALERIQTPKGKDPWVAKLTPLGEAMSKFPVSPRFAKMLCLSHQHNLIEYIVALVAALSVQELVMTSNESGEKVKQRRQVWAGQGNFKLLGDAMVLLEAIGGAEHANTLGNLEEFCRRHQIRLKGIIEARKIRVQLTNEINLAVPDLNLSVNPKMQPPTDIQAKLVRQIMLSGMLDQVARKSDEPQPAGTKKRPLYHTPIMEGTVQMHSSSVLYREHPDWVVYQESYETNKTYLRGITAIEPEWLPIYGSMFCRFGPPLESPAPRYDPSTGLIYCSVKGTFGKRGWELPIAEIEFPSSNPNKQFPLGIEMIKYKWFAMFLLDGSIFPKLKMYIKDLLSTPKTMIRSWAKLQPRTQIFINTLISNEIDSKAKLLEIWGKDSKFLLSAYQNWLPEALHNAVAIMWPPK